MSLVQSGTLLGVFSQQTWQLMITRGFEGIGVFLEAVFLTPRRLKISLTG